MPHPLSIQLTVDKYLDGVRIDQFLIRHFRNYTPYRMQRLIAARQVQIDALPALPEQRVYCSQFVSICLTEPPDKLLPSEQMPLDMLYEDAWIGVLNKPAGCVAHPVGPYQTGTLCNGLQWHFDRQSPCPGLIRPGIVHRLDRQTSGVMVFSKEHFSHRDLSYQFQNGKTQKTYLAITLGIPSRQTGTIDLPIGLHSNNNGVLMAAGTLALQAKRATTNYKVLDQIGNHALVQAQPLTGRNHQVRVHLAAIGCPIVGDEFYAAFGQVKTERPADDDSATNRSVNNSSSDEVRHALHASQLTISHPITRQRMTFTAPLPRELACQWDALSKTNIACT